MEHAEWLVKEEKRKVEEENIRKEEEERRGGGRIGFAANVENGKLWTGALTARQLFTKPFKSSHRLQQHHIFMTPPSIIGFVFVFVFVFVK